MATLRHNVGIINAFLYDTWSTSVYLCVISSKKRAAESESTKRRAQLCENNIHMKKLVKKLHYIEFYEKWQVCQAHVCYELILCNIKRVCRVVDAKVYSFTKELRWKMCKNVRKWTFFIGFLARSNGCNNQMETNHIRLGCITVEWLQLFTR